MQDSIHDESSDAAAGALGDLLRERRKALGLTLSEAAKRAGMAVSYLSMVETGRVARPPSAERLRGLAAALELEAEALIEAGAWARTPEPVKRAVTALQDHAAAGRDLARWLRDAADADAGGQGLDELFRSGALRRRIEQALGDEPAPRGEGGAPRPAPPLALPRMRGVPLINKVAAGYPTDFTDLDYPARVADDYVTVPGVNDPDAFAATVTGDSMLPDYGEGDLVVFSPLADVADGCDCFVRLEPSHETTFKRVYFEVADAGERIRLQPLNPAYPPRTVPREQVAGLYRAVRKVAAV